MIKIAITLAMLLCATATHAQTVIEKLCIVTAAQDLPRVPGLEIKASRITVGAGRVSRQSGHEIFWCRDRCCGRWPKHDLCVCLRDLAAAAAIYAIDRDRALDWHAFKKLAAQTA